MPLITWRAPRSQSGILGHLTSVFVVQDHDRLARLLEACDKESPFEGVEGVHAGQIAVLESLPGRRGPIEQTQLVVTVVADGDPTTFPARLARRGAPLSELLSCCSGFGGDVARFVRDHTVEPAVSFATNPRSLPDVLRALALRDEFAMLVADRARLEPAELRRRFAAMADRNSQHG